MSFRAYKAAVCLLLAFLLAVGTLVSSVRVVVSHNPAVMLAAEAERHALLAAEIAEHGHSHDDGEGDEQVPGHSHGHDVSDHSHDVPSLAPTLPGPLPRAWRALGLAVTAVAKVDQAFPFDRPPRTRLSA